MSGEKLIKSETAAGGKKGGREAGGLKDRRSMKAREKGASGSGPPGGSRLLLLSSLSNCPSFTPSPYHSHFICNPPIHPFSDFFLLLSPPSLPPSLSFAAFLPASHSFSGPQSEDRMLAGGCCRGGRVMSCLSPPSRLDRSSRKSITTTTQHYSVLHTVACLPAYCCCCC